MPRGVAVPPAVTATSSSGRSMESPPESDAVARVRASYDAVAARYAAAFADELEGKPLERGLLDAFAELCGAAGRAGTDSPATTRAPRVVPPVAWRVAFEEPGP